MPHKRRVGPGSMRRRATPYLLLAPALAFVTLLFVIPLLYNLVISFFDWSVIRTPTFIRLENYQRVWTSARFLAVVKNTVTFSLLSVPAAVVISLLVAMGFHSLGNSRGSSVLRALYFAPVVASLTAVSYVWVWIYHPSYGLANALLNGLGRPGLDWLTSPTQVLPSLAVMYIWARIGFNAIILLAGINAIDGTYYEAARIDGASRFQQFRNITLPLLNRQLVLVITVEVMNTLKIFELPFAATKGGPVGASRSVVMEVYEQAFRFDRWGQSAVYVVTLFVGIMVITGVLRRLLVRDISE